MTFIKQIPGLKPAGFGSLNGYHQSKLYKTKNRFGLIMPPVS